MVPSRFATILVMFCGAALTAALTFGIGPGEPTATPQPYPPRVVDEKLRRPRPHVSLPGPIPTTTTFDLARLGPIVEWVAKATTKVEPRPRATTNPPGSLDRCAYADLIRSIWQQDAEWAIGIAWRESRCQPAARNPEGAAGLFQLYRHDDLIAAAGPGCVWSDPVCNTTAAWRLYLGCGRGPWSPPYYCRAP